MSETSKFGFYSSRNCKGLRPPSADPPAIGMQDAAEKVVKAAFLKGVRGQAGSRRTTSCLETGPLGGQGGQSDLGQGHLGGQTQQNGLGQGQ